VDLFCAGLNEKSLRSQDGGKKQLEDAANKQTNQLTLRKASPNPSGT